MVAPADADHVTAEGSIAICLPSAVNATYDNLTLEPHGTSPGTPATAARSTSAATETRTGADEMPLEAASTVVSPYLSPTTEPSALTPRIDGSADVSVTAPGKRGTGRKFASMPDTWTIR